MNKNTHLSSYSVLRCISILLLLSCLLTLVTWNLNVTAVTPKAPYMIAIENITGATGKTAENELIIYRDCQLPIDTPIEIDGWLATPEGVHHYECAFVPATGGSPQWRETDRQEIFARSDLTNVGIPHSTGHYSAGYHLTILPDKDMTDGYYDLYVRAVTEGDAVCDLLVMADMAYGSPDIVKNGVYSFSFSRLARAEGDLVNSEIKDSNLLLHSGGTAKLGNFYMGVFEQIKITYSIPKAFDNSKQAVLGLKTSQNHPYGNGSGKYNMTDNLLYVPVDTSKAGTLQAVELDLTDLNLSYSGDVYLCGYHSDTIQIHGVEMTYINQSHTRTAAKLYFSQDTIPHFLGHNRIELSDIEDKVMGQVLRFTVTEDTNDPFVTFNAESLMKAYDVRLNADDYKYMVVLARSASRNHGNTGTFYLAAGSITGATEKCTYSYQMINDDQWHYYLIDLSEKDTWEGTIHNWRFDILNGDSLAGDYVDVATVQFFRTHDAAQKAAQASTTQCDTPTVLGQPLLYQDMQEETAREEQDFVISPEDCFVVTEAETESETTPEAVTTPSPADTTSETSTQAETNTTSLPEPTETHEETKTEGGCASAVGFVPIVLIGSLVILSVIYNQTKKTNRRKQS